MRPRQRDRKKKIWRGLIALLLVGAGIYGAVKLFQGQLAQKFLPSVLDEGGEGATSYATRNKIYDRNLEELAVSFRLTSVFARPLEMKSPERVADKVAAILGGDKEELLAALRSERGFVWLGRQMGAGIAEQILEQNLEGVYSLEEVHRFYPQKKTAAHAVGYVKDEQGLAGVEFYYDSLLKATSLIEPDLRDAAAETRAGERGGDLILTLDLKIQKRFERLLESLAAAASAESARGLMMDGNSGAVLALANRPTFDPNLFWDYTASQRRNRVVTDPVMIGGMNRFFRLAAVIDRYGREAASQAGAGQEERGASFWQPVREGVWVSLELGGSTWPAASPQVLSGFAERLGFLRKSQLDLPQEGDEDVPGGAETARSFRLEDPASTTTTVHLLSAFLRVMHSGRPITPHLLRAVWNESGVREASPGDQAMTGSIRNEVGILLRGMLADPGRPGSIYLESLAADEMPGETAVPETVAVELSPSADKGESEGKDRPARRYQALMLGLGPQGGRPFGFAVVLDSAKLDPGQPSPLRPLVERFVRQAAAELKRSPAALPASRPAGGEEAYYRQWLEEYGGRDSRPHNGGDRQTDGMPDVRGSSLRRALQLLQPYGLRITVQGSGQVKRQVPPPGRSLQGVEECILVLQADGP